MKLTKEQQYFKAFVKGTVAKLIKEESEPEMNTDKVVREALYEMDSEDEVPEKSTTLDIPYDAYSVLTQYWFGQGDPLYAVLSRSSGDKINPSESELGRLITATQDAIRDLEASSDSNSSDDDALMSLYQFHNDANAAYEKLTGYSEEPTTEEVSYSLRGHFGEAVEHDNMSGMYDSVDDIVKKYVAQVRNNFSQDQNILSIMETAIVDGYNLGLDEARKVADEDNSVSMPMPQTDDADQSYTFNPFSRKSRKQ